MQNEIKGERKRATKMNSHNKRLARQGERERERERDIYIYSRLYGHRPFVCRRKFLAFFDILVSIRDKIKVNWPMTLTPQKGHDSRSSLQELRSKLPVCFDIVPFTPQKGHDSRFSLQELRNPSQFLCSGPYFQGVWGGHSWFWLTLSGSFWGSV